MTATRERYVVSRPLLLDLFCGEGGASTGYHSAGFDVVGVDIRPQPYYPFEFHQQDALTFVRGHWREFDAVAASPPCQSETSLRHLSANNHPNLLGPTLDLLTTLPVPWIVENVSATRQMPGALVLCGTEFGLKTVCRDGVTRWLSRHRRFASNLFLYGAGGCHCTTGKKIGGVYGTGGGGRMTHSYKFHPAEARAVMDIHWMSRKGIAQAIPPAYTAFLGGQLLDAVTAGASTTGSVRSA